jgi:hypothetical protein
MINPDIKTVSFIRVAGTPNFVEFSTGLRIYNDGKDYIEMPEWGRRVKKAEYYNHFLARHPKFTTEKGAWFAYCSCGSPGVVVGYNAYKQDASPSSGKGFATGELLVCHHHATYGKHRDGSV